GTDETALDVGVYGAGGGLRPRALGDRPRAHLVLADREERHEPEQRIAFTQHAVDRRLLQAEIGQEGALLVAGELGHFGLADRRDPADAGPRARGRLLESELLDRVRAVGDRLLVEIQAVQDRFL